MSTLREQIDEQLSQLHEPAQREVLDFIQFLRQKQNAELSNLMDSIITDNLEALKELAK